MDLNLFSSILLALFYGYFSHGLPTQDDLYEGSACKLENGRTGVCKKIHDCPSRIKEVMAGKRTSDSSGRCGFQDFTEIVCCRHNITDKIGLRPAEIACRQYESEVGTTRNDLDVEFHIYGGSPAEPGEFPYMVALGYENRNDDDEAVKYYCGGTLISSQHVLTAAHCVNNIQERVPVEVRIGSEDLKNVGNVSQRIPVSDVISHPRYKRSTNYDDVAILKLSSPVRVASNARPICIQTKSLSASAPANVSFIVTGWGATSFEGDTSDKLMKTPSLSIMDRESCAKSFEDFAKLPRGIDENLLCVVDSNVTRRADACGGDSGGPLLMIAGPNHSIVGITAFGQPCGGPVPGIYTAVYSYLEWIEREVWPEMVDDRRPTVDDTPLTSVIKISASFGGSPIRDPSDARPDDDSEEAR